MSNSILLTLAISTPCTNYTVFESMNWERKWERENRGIRRGRRGTRKVEGVGRGRVGGGSERVEGMHT